MECNYNVHTDISRITLATITQTREKKLNTLEMTRYPDIAVSKLMHVPGKTGGMLVEIFTIPNVFSVYKTPQAYTEPEIPRTAHQPTDPPVVYKHYKQHGRFNL